MAGNPRRVTCDELREIGEDDPVVESWRILCSRGAASTPFQRPEWIVPWWRVFAAADGSPRLLTVRSRVDAELLGVAAIWVRAENSGVRRVALVGSGNSDYVDVVAMPKDREAVATALMDYLWDIRSEWDACDLNPLPSTSPLLGIDPPAGWNVLRTPYAVSPILHLREGEDSVPAGLRHQLQYARRRLERRGRVGVVDANESNAISLFQQLCLLHESRWRMRGEAGLLADARVLQFHQGVVPAMARAGVLRLHVINVDGRAVSAFYGFAQHGGLYYYLGAFDPAFARESVGSLAILAAVERARARGDTMLDFLYGAEPYKYRWGAVDRYSHRVSITPSERPAEKPS